MTSSKSFAEFIETELRRKGWSAGDLAGKLGVDASYVRRILAGSRVPTRGGPALLSKLSTALELPAQREAELKAVWSASVQQRDSSAAADIIERLLEDGKKKSAQSQSGSTRPVRSRPIPAMSHWVYSLKDILTLIPTTKGVRYKNIYVHTPDALLESPDMHELFVAMSQISETITHLTPPPTTSLDALRLSEILVGITEAMVESPEHYRPIITPNTGLPGLIIGTGFALLVFSISEDRRQFLVLQTSAPRIGTVFKTIMANLANGGSEFLRMMSVKDFDFQVEMDRIESRTSVRFGVFDEGFSFITHPDHWYSDNNPFGQHAPWDAWPHDAQKRRYKELLRGRLRRVGRSFDTMELTSERSILRYIKDGRTSDDFYPNAFPPDVRREHVEHVCRMLRDPTSRYSLYVVGGEEVVVDNKGWIAYDDTVAFFKVLGANNMGAILFDRLVAMAFRSVFDSLKKKAMRRFPTPNATADWLTARLHEMIPK